MASHERNCAEKLHSSDPTVDVATNLDVSLPTRRRRAASEELYSNETKRDLNVRNTVRGGC